MENAQVRVDVFMNIASSVWSYGMQVPSCVMTRDRIIGKCLFCFLRSCRVTLIYNHELEVKIFYGVFMMPINVYF